MMINGSHNVCILFIPQHCVQCKGPYNDNCNFCDKSHSTCASNSSSSTSYSCSNCTSPTSFPITSDYEDAFFKNTNNDTTSSSTSGTTNGSTASGTSDVSDSAAADPTDDAYHNIHCASPIKGMVL